MRKSTRKWIPYTTKMKWRLRLMRSWFTLVWDKSAQVLWLTLTSPSGSDKNTLYPDFLIKRIKKEYRYEPEYFGVMTSEGNGVIHVYLAVERKKAIYIDREWLVEQWKDIHGAWNVGILRITSPEHGGNNMRYTVEQYTVKQEGEKDDTKTFYSRRWLPFPLTKTWLKLNEIIKSKMPVIGHEKMWGRETEIHERLPKEKILELWQELLLRKSVLVGDELFEIIDGELISTRRVVEVFELKEGREVTF